MYRLGKWQARMQEFKDSPELKTLNNELGILRIIFEETLAQAQTSEELLFAAGKIMQISDKIKETLNVSTQLELKLNQHLSTQQLFAIAEQILNLAIKYIPDPAQCDKLATEFAELLTSASQVSPTGFLEAQSPKNLIPAQNTVLDSPDYLQRPVDASASIQITGTVVPRPDSPSSDAPLRME